MSSSHSRLALGTLAMLTIAVACGRSGVPNGSGSGDDDDGGTTRTLTVDVRGNGRPYSRVRSVPAGISCPGVCAADFPVDTAVALTASSGTATFIDWTGSCAANAGPDCALVLSTDLTAVARLATSGSVVWAKLFGDGGSANGVEVVVATNGDAVTAGTFQGSAAQFGDDSCVLSSSGGDDAFVTRHTPSGDCVWARKMGGTDDDVVRVLAGSEYGLFVLRGEFLSPTFVTNGDDITKTGAGDDAFTVLMGGDAQVLRSAGSPEPNRRAGLTACFGAERRFFVGDAVDANNDGEHVVFYYRVEVEPPGTVTPRQTARNGAGTFDAVTRTSACAAGGVVLAGVHDPSVNQGLGFPGGGGASVPGAGSTPDDVWMARISTAGTFDVTWTQRFGGLGNQENPSIAALPDGQLLVAIDVNDTTSIGGASVPGTPVVVPDNSLDGNLDILVARLDANGALQRARVYGTGGEQSVSSVAFAGSLGETILAGLYGAPFELAPSPSAGDDLFVARLDSSGKPVWTRSFGGTNDDRTGTVAIRSKHLYLTGTIAGSAPFVVETFIGPASLAPVGGSDVLLMRLVP